MATSRTTQDRQHKSKIEKEFTKLKVARKAETKFTAENVSQIKAGPGIGWVYPEILKVCGRFTRI